jgi:hypothetical protein
MKKQTVIDLVKLWFPEWKNEKDRLDTVDLWYNGKNTDIKAPTGATTELKRLIELSKTPWLGLVVTTVAQTMFVDGIRSSRQDAAEPLGDITGPWRTWLANQMPSRQIAIHRANLAYGYAFATALPGVDAFGTKMAVLRGASPRKMFAVYGNPAEDEWPLFALQFEANGKDKYRVKVLDESSVYYLDSNADGSTVDFIEERVHGLGVTPVVRYTNMLDLDGRTPGEVEPFIPIAARIDKTDFDRLVTQHYASWKKLWIAGMEKPSPEQDANGIKIKMAQDDIIVSDNVETRFGAFEASELTGFISAKENDVETLAAVSQTPSHSLTGKMINIGAEALAAARAQLDQKSGERKVSAGVSHDQLLRLAARIEGDMESAADVTAHVTWQDTSIRSLSSAADALGKMATMLGIPVEALWSRVPGVTKTDVDEWKQMAEAQAERSPEGQLAASLTRQVADV